MLHLSHVVLALGCRAASLACSLEVDVETIQSLAFVLTFSFSSKLYQAGTAIFETYAYRKYVLK